MNEYKAARDVMVVNPQGLHLRMANLVAACAGKFNAKIELVRDNDRVNGKSIIDLLGLGAPKGTRLTVVAIGQDADAALEALAEVFLRESAEEPTHSDFDGKPR